MEEGSLKLDRVLRALRRMLQHESNKMLWHFVNNIELYRKRYFGEGGNIYFHSICRNGRMRRIDANEENHVRWTYATIDAP